MTPEAQRLADEFKRLMVDYCQAVLNCSDRATDQNVKAVVRAENATYSAIDRLASLIPAGGLAEEADWSGRIVEIDYETHRAIVRYEGHHPGIGIIVRVDELGSRAAAMAASTPQGQEKTR